MNDESYAARARLDKLIHAGLLPLLLLRALLRCRPRLPRQPGGPTQGGTR